MVLDDNVEEACFYLSELKIDPGDIASEFNLDVKQVRAAIRSFKKKIQIGKAEYDDETKQFWSKNYRESRGDLKITLVDDKGRYYHGWKSELDEMDTEKLVQLLVVNKQYSDRHPLAEFTKSEAVIGYDPMVPLRNIRKTVLMIEEILQRREDSET